MATDKTKLTELGTAVGIFVEPDAPWPAPVEHLDLPGLDRADWQPVVLPATTTTHPDRHLLQRAIGNGQAFRAQVLRGRRPDRIEWSAGGRNTWLSDIPRDLTVDGVWFIQAKYDSTCVLNTSPAMLVDHLLLDDGGGTRDSWYVAVALAELQDYYRMVRGRALDGHDLPADVRDLDGAHKRMLKSFMRATEPSAAEDDAYRALSHAVSIETARRWEHRLRSSTDPQRTQMLFRMLRIAGGPYWVLGSKGARPVRLAVADTRTWRERFKLKRFEVHAARAGQPQVQWRASIGEGATGEVHHVEGFCEIRWSHGKLQGHPECKVQVATPLADLPGYDPLGTP